MESNAVISECGQYRYRLSRRWDDGPTMAFVMLNPSTADAVDNDPTIERCVRRAKSLGFGELVVSNLFALRATDPGYLYVHPAPVGPGNDEAIIEVAKDADLVVCGWGTHGSFEDRGEAVRKLLVANGVMPQVLALNKDGSPRHPLYVGYAVKPAPWEA